MAEMHKFWINKLVNVLPQDTLCDELQYWMKVVECLHACVAVLEEIICSLNGKEYLEKALGGPICSLEDIMSFFQQYPASPVTLRIDTFSKLGKGIPFTHQTERIEQGETSHGADNSSAAAGASHCNSLSQYAFV
ncbi:hypothetical protein CIHG_10248 [Coccidioides immitis H538.4]|uniref:Uncharacterized protein n=1 Tax=Coccidioides immitis H538.4 TaxID=396776 RepID=A0A0J8UWX1_COCIT|nr:hypothetical protein CIHG_10248 [Coccidioides immitis H538.4]